MTDQPAQLEFRLGLDAINSYKRLDYTPWHALAEFVDNSTQSFFNHSEELQQAYTEESDDRLLVSIVYDNDAESLRISDNAMGMDRTELDHALEVGAPPANTAGRSKFGMGMKTAACWFGNTWTIRTKKLGETTELTVEVDVEKVAAGDRELPTTEKAGQAPEDHYTILEITELNRPLRGQTHRKIRDFLSSMYRQDLKDNIRRSGRLCGSLGRAGPLGASDLLETSRGGRVERDRWIAPRNHGFKRQR